MFQSDKCLITNKNKSLTLFIIGNIITILLKNLNAIIVLHRLTLLVLLILTFFYPSVTTNTAESEQRTRHYKTCLLLSTKNMEPTRNQE